METPSSWSSPSGTVASLATGSGDKIVDAHRQAMAQPHLSVGGQVFHGNYKDVQCGVNSSAAK